MDRQVNNKKFYTTPATDHDKYENLKLIHMLCYYESAFYIKRIHTDKILLKSQRGLFFKM